MWFLREHNINAYLFGCIVSTFPKASTYQTRDKVYFVDVPTGVKQYIPKNIMSSIEFADHEFYETLDEWGKDSGKTRAKQLIEMYSKSARLIVTSRFHGAVLGLALGIPTIVTVENNNFKWSWISKQLQIYTPDSFKDIDWNCHAADFESIKKRMLSVAKRQIVETYEKYNDIYSLSSLHENKNRDDSPNLLYCNSALEYIRTLWQRQNVRAYIIWGVSQNAELIYQTLLKEFPDARLVKVYDYARNCDFHGISSLQPTEEEILRDKDIFTIVTSNSAKTMAEEMFKQIGKARDDFVLCKLSFIDRASLNNDVNE